MKSALVLITLTTEKNLKKYFLLTSPSERIFSAKLKHKKHNLGLKTPSGKKAGQKAIDTSMTGEQEILTWDLWVASQYCIWLGLAACQQKN